MNEVLVARYLSGEANSSEVAAIKEQLTHAPEFAKELEALQAAWTATGPKTERFNVARIRSELAVRIGMVPEKTVRPAAIPFPVPARVHNGTGASRAQWLGVGLVVAAACGILYMRAAGVAPQTGPTPSDPRPSTATEQVVTTTEKPSQVTREDSPQQPKRVSKGEPERYRPPDAPVTGASWFELATMRRYGGSWTDNNADQSQLQLSVPRISTQPRDEIRGSEKDSRGQSLPTPRKRERKQGQSSS